MITPHLDKSLLYLLNDVYLTGAGLQETRDALAVVRILRRLRPLSPAFAVAEALQLNDDREYLVARLVLEEADTLNPGHALVKAALALTLFRQHDSLWQAYLEEVKALQLDEKTHPLVTTIVDSIERLARNERAEPDEHDAVAEVNTSYLPYLQMGVAC